MKPVFDDVPPVKTAGSVKTVTSLPAECECIFVLDSGVPKPLVPPGIGPRQPVQIFARKGEPPHLLAGERWLFLFSWLKFYHISTIAGQPLWGYKQGLLLSDDGHRSGGQIRFRVKYKKRTHAGFLREPMFQGFVF